MAWIFQKVMQMGTVSKNRLFVVSESLKIYTPWLWVMSHDQYGKKCGQGKI